MRGVLSGVLMSLVLSASASAQSVGGVPDAEHTSQSSLSAADKLFIDQAAASGLAEVESGGLATEKGDARVKTIANMMVADHTSMNNRLLTIAQANNVTPPTTLNATDQKIAKTLAGEKGSVFDHEYLAEEKQAHIAAIALFKKEASTGQNQALKTFAQTNLPVLSKHLMLVETALSN